MNLSSFSHIDIYIQICLLILHENEYDQDSPLGAKTRVKHLQRSKWLSKALVDTEIFSLCKKPWLFFLGSVLLNKKSPDVFIEIVHLSKWEKLKVKKAWNFNTSLFHHKCFPGNFEIFRLFFPKTLSWRLPLIYDKSYRELKKKKNLFLAFN